MGAVARWFAQMLALLDRRDVVRAVQQHAAERAAKGFGCGDHCVAMLFGQRGRAHALRAIGGGVATALGQRVHLGVRRTPTRSTRAYANAHRPWPLYEPRFSHVLSRCQAVAALKRRRFRFTQPLRTLDPTIIDLCATGFDGARLQRTNGAITRHRQRDHQGCVPGWARVPDGETNAVRIAQQRSFAPGTIVAIDRGYLADARYHRWTVGEVGVVTRPRTNRLDEVLEQRPVPTRGSVLVDEVIRLTSAPAAGRCPVPLRPVLIWDERQQRRRTFLTNLLHRAARTIAAIDKERGQSERRFKAVKQQLRIKTCVGTSENAVPVQLWIALIAMRLLKLLQLQSTWPWSLSTRAALLRFNLLPDRDLWAWLDAPFERPVLMPVPLHVRRFAP